MFPQGTLVITQDGLKLTVSKDGKYFDSDGKEWGCNVSQLRVIVIPPDAVIDLKGEDNNEI